MAESKESKRRIALLESASPAARAHSSLTLALASAYADAGRRWKRRSRSSGNRNFNLFHDVSDRQCHILLQSLGRPYFQDIQR